MLNQTDKQNELKYMEEAIKLSEKGMEGNYGGPFGAVVVKNGKVAGRGFNRVTSSNDPTAHAEIVAIRDACKNINTYDLSGCDIYVSCEPCPMCLSAIYWANIDRVFYANTKKDAANIGFRDNFLYKEICKPVGERKKEFNQIMHNEAKKVFQKWQKKPDRIEY